MQILTLCTGCLCYVDQQRNHGQRNEQKIDKMGVCSQPFGRQRVSKALFFCFMFLNITVLEHPEEQNFVLQKFKKSFVLSKKCLKLCYFLTNFFQEKCVYLK